ncbi:hypothetical protein EYF80_042819 [Liparis tanakae]|uniref:Uncharacterized protein n=1 Tax=Liparis tanakae TaxID=230148 RepID=A0A4Z2G1D5_9TELE|nr:hypothetical protein EYF80_042819 [Liparis tanakae]
MITEERDMAVNRFVYAVHNSLQRPGEARGDSDSVNNKTLRLFTRRNDFRLRRDEEGLEESAALCGPPLCSCSCCCCCPPLEPDVLWKRRAPDASRNPVDLRLKGL